MSEKPKRYTWEEYEKYEPVITNSPTIDISLRDIYELKRESFYANEPYIDWLEAEVTNWKVTASAECEQTRDVEADNRNLEARIKELEETRSKSQVKRIDHQMKARIKELEGTVKELSCDNALNIAEETIATLKEALEKITSHSDICSFTIHSRHGCDCYVDVAQTALSKCSREG